MTKKFVEHVHGIKCDILISMDMNCKQWQATQLNLFFNNCQIITYCIVSFIELPVVDHNTSGNFLFCFKQYILNGKGITFWWKFIDNYSFYGLILYT